MVSMTRLLLLWFGFIVSTGAHLEKRVIGGRPCPPDDRHYHVRISSINSDGSTSFCGGSLISDRWILTAAHCWTPGSTMYAVVGVHPGPGQRVEIISAPRIYIDPSSDMHDIMLLKLPYSTNMPYIRLPDCRNRPQIINIAGHAATTTCFNGQRRPGKTSKLNCEDMYVVQCRQMLYLPESHLYVVQFCGQRRGVDACLGDSGGGVVYKNKIYGVISNGDTDYPCRSPTGFVDICYQEYFDWIRYTINAP